MALDAIEAAQAACPHPPESFGYLGSMGDGCKACGAIGVESGLLSFCADLCEHGSETPCAAEAPVICRAAGCGYYDTDEHDDPGLCPRHTMPLYDENEPCSTCALTRSQHGDAADHPFTYPHHDDDCADDCALDACVFYSDERG